MIQINSQGWSPENAITMSYHDHPIEHIEPIIDNDDLIDVTNYFLRVWAWVNDGSNYQARAIRAHIVIMILFPQLGCPDGSDYTNDSIGKAYGLTRQAVNVVVQKFRDQFPTSNIKNRSMRSQQTRDKCRKAQDKANSKPMKQRSSAKYGNFMSRLKDTHKV